MLFNTTEKKIEMTFGSPQVNDWKTFMVEKLQEQEIIVNLPYEKAGKDFKKLTPGKYRIAADVAKLDITAEFELK